MNQEKVIYSIVDNVATLALNSPSNLNAFDQLMIEEVVTALKEAGDDPEVEVVVLTSTGKAFSGGGDIKMMYQEMKNDTMDFDSIISQLAAIAITMKKLTKPVICSVDGPVVGAGFNVALAADLIVATDSAVFSQAFVNIGLISDAGGLYLLTRAVGVNKALELAMLGETITATEGQRLGFVTKLTTSDELAATTDKLARKLTKGPSVAYRETKRLIFESEFKEFEAYIQEEILAQKRCGETTDFKEGISAFVEKRPPIFK